jgi:uncharacterized protein YukE
MPYQTISVRRARHFTPDEAHTIAAELRAIASEARNLAARLRTINGNLEATWEGQAKNRFLVNFSCEPSVGESSASWLEAEAQRISSITVTVWETVSERLWVPGPEDQGEVGL